MTKNETGNGEQESASQLRHGLVLAGFLAIAGYFLWTEHEAHVRALFPYLPWLFLLACPLMHVFMHGGHGRGYESAGGPRRKDGREKCLRKTS